MWEVTKASDVFALARSATTSERNKAWIISPDGVPVPQKMLPKNPTPPPTVTNSPHNITDPPIYVTDFPIYITNPPINITRTKPHSRIASRAKPGNLTSFWLSGFPRASQCTNTPNSTQKIRQQNQSLTGDFLDKIALIAPSQNCSTWNNLLFHAKTAQTARL
jgi:hypothetical protein